MEENRSRLDERHVQVQGTKSSWTGLKGWLDEARRIGATSRFSAAQYRRIELVYCSLDVCGIHACRDLVVRYEFEEEMCNGRYTDSRFRRFFRVFSRRKIGVFITQVRNQSAWVNGCCLRRKPGPTLDPWCLPDNRHDFLIQSHKDWQLVEKFRAEKRRRQVLA